MRFLILLLLAFPAFGQTVIGPGESHTVMARDCPAVQQKNMLVSVGIGGWFVEVISVDDEDHANVGAVIDEIGAQGLVMQFSSGWLFDFDHGQRFPEPGPWMLQPGGHEDVDRHPDHLGKVYTVEQLGGVFGEAQ